MKHIEQFHYLTQDLQVRTHAELAEMACLVGAKWIQLRIKNKSFDEWKQMAIKVRKICNTHGAVCIVNDNAAIAYEAGADGVHLGMQDMPVREARSILGDNCIIGGTANTAADVEYHLNQGADYIGIGPYRFTETKKNPAPVLDLQGIAQLAKQFSEIPIIAIGGIQLEDVDVLMETGIHGIAVSSAVNMAQDPAQAAKNFLEVLKCSH
jgi:thiamine-phosphate pyrophosphorylase